MWELNPNLYPADGYLFTNADGTVIRGESYRDLESRVRGYRALNKMDPGDPWTEIITQFCAKQSSLCRPEGPAIVNGGHVETFNQKVIAWFVSIIGLKRVNRLPRVDDAEAQRRADICARCPMQRSLNEACRPCLHSIETSRKAVLDGCDSLHRNLQCCGALGEDPSIAVHIQQSPANAPNMPGNCWRRQG